MHSLNLTQQHKNKVTAAAAATKDASCAATTWEIFDEQSKATDQGTVDDGVYGGAGSKTEVGGEETAVQRQAGELATVTLARYVFDPQPGKKACEIPEHLTTCASRNSCLPVGLVAGDLVLLVSVERRCPCGPSMTIRHHGLT